MTGPGYDVPNVRDVPPSIVRFTDGVPVVAVVFIYTVCAVAPVHVSVYVRFDVITPPGITSLYVTGVVPTLGCEFADSGALPVLLHPVNGLPVPPLVPIHESCEIF